jgi:DNA-binding ferritin-like protein (Dps family)
MDGFQAYQYSNAINMHFNRNYDAFKYRFKTRVSQKSYWGRSDKYQLTKIGQRFNKEEDIVRYFAAHQLAGNKWVGDMIRNEKDYTDFLSRIDSLSYNFKQEMDSLDEYSIDGLLSQYKSNYPQIIDKYLDDTISLETVCILNEITGFMHNANKQISETILWPDIYTKVIKYSPFLNIERSKFIKILLTIFGK